MNSRTVASLLFLLSLAGCSVRAETGPDYVQHSGTLVLDWTIEGSKDGSLCDLSDADTLDVVVTWPDGSLAGEYEQSCRAFATSIDLAPGTYRAEALLLDFSGRDRTTSVQLGTFDIYGHDELVIPIDFPASSFY